MKRTLMGLLIVALLGGVADADPFIGPAGNPTLRYSINIADGVDMTALGDTDVNWGTGDVTTTGAGSFGTMTTSGATTGAGATYSGIVIAEHFNSTDDARIADDLSVEGDADVEGAFTAGSVASDAGVSGTTGTFTEPVTISKTTGTAPLNVTSTTKNTNFNADLLDDHDSAYFATAADVGTVANLNNGETDLVEAVNATDVRLDTLETDTGANVTRIENLETAVGTAGNLDTTATDLVGAINETAGEVDTNTAAISTLETDLGNNDTRTTALEARTYIHVQVITDPVVAAADTIVGSTPINETGFTLAPGDLSAQPDVTRTLSVTPSGTLTGWVLIEGTNIEGENITEYVNFSASSSLADTDKAFKTITQITGAKESGDDQTITIGQTDELGLDMTVDNDYQLMMVKFDGGIDATQTLTKDSTDVELNNIDIAGTLDGLKTIWVYLIVE